MSVLNQMLVDLDRRRASGAERIALPEHVRALPAERRRGPVAAWVLGVALVGAAAALAWYGSERWSIRGTSTRNAVVEEQARAVAPITGARESVPAESQNLVREARVNADTAAAPAALPPRQADLTRETADAPAGAAPRGARRGTPLGVAQHDASVRHAPAEQAPDPGRAAEIAKQVRPVTREQQAQVEYDKAAALIQQGRTVEAREVLEAALRAHPAHAAARQALTGLLVSAREYAEAERLLREGLRQWPQHSAYAIALARLQVDRSDVNGAIDTLERHRAHAEQSADYLGFLAALLQRQQRHAEAIDAFHAALRLRPQNSVWLMGLGISLQAAQRPDEAHDAYRRAKAAGGLAPELQAFVEQRLREH